MTSTGALDLAAFARFQQNGAAWNPETWSALAEHFGAYGFSPTQVMEPPLTEQLSVHLKVHVCPPSERHPFVTLFTTGMSDRPQSVPSKQADCRFAELMMLLPPTWPGLFNEIAILDRGMPIARTLIPADAQSKPPEYEWVMAWLLQIARYPHLTGQWVGPGHLFPTADAEPLLGTGFTGFVLLEPISIPWQIRARDGRSIALHTVMPLYPDEIDFKRRKGTRELLRRFSEHRIGEVVDPHRPNVGAGGKSWWPFRK